MATNNADNISSSGFVTYDGAGTFSGRTLSPGVQNTIAITNGTGAAGNPTFEVTVNNLTNIPNSALANDSVTITAGTGLSGGGAVVLGGTTSVALATPVSSANGGTGVNNGTSTLTLGGNLATSGAFASTFTMTGATGVTFPTSGTLATTSQLPSLPLSPASGGTGIANNAASTLAISGNFATTLTVTNTTGVTLPTSGTLATTSQIPALPLTVSNGGTGVGTLTSHGVLLGQGTGNVSATAAGSAGQVLQSGGASADPTYSTATYPSTASSSGTFLRANGTNWLTSSSTIPDTFSQGDLIYGSAANTLTALAKDTNSTRYLSNTGTTNNPAWAQVALTTGVSGTLPVGNGGTGVANPTAHDLLIGNGSSAMTQLAPSATSGVPLISQGSSSDPAYGTAVVAGGGTGVTSFANTSALLASGTTTTGTLQNIASVATGQVLTSAGTSTLPAWSASPSVTSITLGGGTALGNYVESTFTPVLGNTGTAPTVTYAANGQVGHYTRIGNIVIFTVRIITTAYTAGTGNAQITGLPITSVNNSNESWGFTMRMQNVTYGASVLWYSANVGVNTTIININGNRSASTLLALAASGPSATTDISVTGTYAVS